MKGVNQKARAMNLGRMATGLQVARMVVGSVTDASVSSLHYDKFWAQDLADLEETLSRLESSVWREIDQATRVKRSPLRKKK